MPIQLGNAAAPRWYERSLERLPAYVAHVRGLGATSTEIVLHHGEADEQTARVHVLGHELRAVLDAFQADSIHVHLHAPLTPEFRVSRWASDRDAAQAIFAPVLRDAAEVAAEQTGQTVLVFHAASGTGDDAGATRAFLDWARETAGGSAGRLRFAIELRQATHAGDARLDRARASLLRFVDGLHRDDVGICWDLGHDWESRTADASWRPVPEGEFLARVTHVHLHGAAPDGSVHHPLQVGEGPWREQLRALQDAGYAGAVTMEIRFRHALAIGEPWEVLAETYRLACEAIGIPRSGSAERT